MKHLLDKNEVNYERKTIKHAMQLKEDLEKLNIKRHQSSIVTLDIEAMYPSIQIEHVKRAVEYFLRDAPEEDKKTAEHCLDMIRFGMANTMVTFNGKYYEYGGTEVESKGLTIGGYESAFLADLVAAFILENLEDLFQNDEGQTYSKIYRDDGFKVELVANRTVEEICNWYGNFQSRVNELIGSDSLQFTMEIWKPDSPPEEVPRYSDKITICRDEAFPYLDLEMYWRNDELQFRVHLKPNQVLKYLNRDSAHTKATFNAIPHGVLRRLACLTSVNEDNENTPLNELYPKHIAALEKANLPLPKVYPTLKEAVAKVKEAEMERNSEDGQRKKKARDKDHKRATYFVLGHSTNFWDTPVCGMIKQLVKKHKLPWLRFKMANSRYPNFGEKLEGDLSSKVMESFVDANMVDLPCNCNVISLRRDGSCLYNGDCRKRMVVYGLENKNTNQVYYGKTVQLMKTRTQQHFKDVWTVIDSNRNPDDMSKKDKAMKTDSFATHFAKICGDCKNSNAVKAKLKEAISVKVIWQGDAIKCTKSARTRNCKLCMMERKQIMKAIRDDKHKVINENDDIYASCKCSTRFHEFTNIHSLALKTRLTQKKVTPKRKGRSTSRISSSSSSKRKCTRRVSPTSPSTNNRQTTPESVSPIPLIDTNVPWEPYRSPSANPSNLQLAQRRAYEENLQSFFEAEQEIDV